MEFFFWTKNLAMNFLFWIFCAAIFLGEFPIFGSSEASKGITMPGDIVLGEIPRGLTSGFTRGYHYKRVVAKCLNSNLFLDFFFTRTRLTHFPN